MNIQEKWVALTLRVQRLWKAAATVMLLASFLIFHLASIGKIEKRGSMMWLIATFVVMYLVGILIGQIWRKSDEEIWQKTVDSVDGENISKRWKVFWQVVKALTIAFCVIVVLVAWPSALGIGLAAAGVGVILAIKVWADV
jgi:hypothetical protein